MRDVNRREAIIVGLGGLAWLAGCAPRQDNISTPGTTSLSPIERTIAEFRNGDDVKLIRENHPHFEVILKHFYGSRVDQYSEAKTVKVSQRYYEGEFYMDVTLILPGIDTDAYNAYMNDFITDFISGSKAKNFAFIFENYLRAQNYRPNE